MAKRLTVDQKKEIFNDLVISQDMGNDVPQSRKVVTDKFGITENQIKQIEDEGIEKQWPPLADAPVAVRV